LLIVLQENVSLVINFSDEKSILIPIHKEKLLITQIVTIMNKKI